ncbi:hypothetical protein [Candidatus Nitrosocosmicus hydrocola]|nr:hypothetical protein [Candidatus Nitrosocosmicus hydrocola]
MLCNYNSSLGTGIVPYWDLTKVYAQDGVLESICVGPGSFGGIQRG